jgi:hypothetical protein
MWRRRSVNLSLLLSFVAKLRCVSTCYTSLLLLLQDQGKPMHVLGVQREG